MGRGERARVILEHLRGKDVLRVLFDPAAAMADGADWLRRKTCAVATPVIGLESLKGQTCSE